MSLTYTWKTEPGFLVYVLCFVEQETELKPRFKFSFWNQKVRIKFRKWNKNKKKLIWQNVLLFPCSSWQGNTQQTKKVDLTKCTLISRFLMIQDDFLKWKIEFLTKTRVSLLEHFIFWQIHNFFHFSCSKLLKLKS